MKLAPTLTFVLRDQLRDLLNDYHECEQTGCQDRMRRDGVEIANQFDTAGFRVVAHVAVIEDAGQGIMSGSQALQEDNMDTFYSFTYRQHNAVTIATVYLIRQFVRFPNVVTATANPLLRDVYDRWVLRFSTV